MSVEPTEAMIEAAAKAYWEAQSHPLLEQAGYPTDWGHQGRSVKQAMKRPIRLALRAALEQVGPATCQLYGHEVEGCGECTPAAATMERHEWDDTGERCRKCGEKDWFAGPVCDGGADFNERRYRK